MKKAFLSIMVLLIAMTMASCESKPDASMLPAPEIEFRAIKSVEGADFKVTVLNVDKAFYGFRFTTVVEYKIADETGNVLFSDSATNSADAGVPVTGTLDGVEAGETLICTVTFSYEGRTTSATASDIVV